MWVPHIEIIINGGPQPIACKTGGPWTQKIHKNITARGSVSFQMGVCVSIWGSLLLKGLRTTVLNDHKPTKAVFIKLLKFKVSSLLWQCTNGPNWFHFYTLFMSALSDLQTCKGTLRNPLWETVVLKPFHVKDPQIDSTVSWSVNIRKWSFVQNVSQLSVFMVHWEHSI